MSTATTLALRKPALTSAITRSVKPLTGPRTPVPSKASTTNVASPTRGSRPAQSALETTCSARKSWAASMSQLARASVESASSSANTATVRSSRGQSCRSCLATARPSPPLFPLPHSTTTFSLATAVIFWPSIRVTACAAFSISKRLGIPRSSMVIRSAERISAAVSARSIRRPCVGETCRGWFSGP